jgi:hypothetical protein
MSTSTDPKVMAADLRQKAQRLLDAAKAIEETYGIAISDEPSTNGSSGVPNGTEAKRRGPKSKNRLQQLIDFFKGHGPMKRKDLFEQCDIPAGTLSMLLAGPDFTKQDDGRWVYIEPK